MKPYRLLPFDREKNSHVCVFMMSLKSIEMFVKMAKIV